MSDADHFLWAILDNPDEDGPRLAFADWLAGHGESAHAELIRLQCALAARPEADELWLEQKLREEELWPALRDRWKDAFEELEWHRSAKPIGVEEFRRGFFNHPVHL